MLMHCYYEIRLLAVKQGGSLPWQDHITCPLSSVLLTQLPATYASYPFAAAGPWMAMLGLLLELWSKSSSHSFWGKIPSMHGPHVTREMVWILAHRRSMLMHIFWLYPQITCRRRDASRLPGKVGGSSSFSCLASLLPLFLVFWPIAANQSSNGLDQLRALAIRNDPLLNVSDPSFV